MMPVHPWHTQLALPRLQHPFGPANAMPVDPLAQLAREARDGDVESQRRLFEAVAPALLPPLRMILGPNHADIEDALQDALIGLLRGLASFRGESSVLHFARRVATKRAIDLRRRDRTTSRKLEQARHLEVPPPPTPREAMAAERRRRRLRELLDDLPEPQAITLAMRVVLGHSIDEIAEATGVPFNTVRSRLRLAKEALRARIETDPALGELLEEKS
jgi:RNA polymerase sigma-70 factor, ECF subfamily